MQASTKTPTAPKPNFALIGAVTLTAGLAASLLAALAVILNLQPELDEYDLILSGDVSGIQRGGEVHFNGLKLGQVLKIELTGDDVGLLRVRVGLKPGTPVRTDSRIDIVSQGVTGARYIDISPGTTNSADLLIATGERHATTLYQAKGEGYKPRDENTLRGVEGSLSSVIDALSDERIEKIGRRLDKTQAATGKAKTRVAKALENSDSVKNVETQSDLIKERAIRTSNYVNSDVRTRLQRLSEQSSDIGHNIDASTAKLEDLSGKAEAAGEFLTQTSKVTPKVASALSGTARALDSIEKDGLLPQKHQVEDLKVPK